MFRSDHFILEESTFMSHVANVAAYVQRKPDRLVLFGATANEPDTEYGWIEPGVPLENSALIPSCMSADSGKSLRRAEVGRAWRTAVLWNKLVFVARTSTRLDVGDDSFHTSWRGWVAPLVFWLRSVRSQSNTSMGVWQRQISPEHSSKPAGHS